MLKTGNGLLTLDNDTTVRPTDTVRLPAFTGGATEIAATVRLQGIGST